MNFAAYGHEGLNTLGEFVHQIEVGGKEVVQMKRLDGVLSENGLSRLDAIKIDVESAARFSAAPGL
jgi:hypothetical protein